jgi:4-hydroxy-3-polyprenylbenzoate decarboxylase
MYGTTRDFVAALERAGELVRVRAPASPILEIAEIADRVSKTPAPHAPSASARRTDPRFHHLGGRALLFENVEAFGAEGGGGDARGRSEFPVLINQFGSYRRMEMALGCNEAGHGLAPGHTPGGFEALAEKVARLVKPEPPPTLLAKLQKIPELLELARMPPRRVRAGICQEVVHAVDGPSRAGVDLRRLPLIRCWPLDGDPAAVGFPADANAGVPGVESGPEWERHGRGRYITLGGVHTVHADDAGNPSPTSRNIGMYRVQLLGPRHMAMHWHMHHDGARHWRSWRARGERMPVAIALGGESVLPYAATAPMPPGISELLLAGFLNRGPIPLVPCRTVPLDVPANSEIVIEGWVDAGGGRGMPNGAGGTAPRTPDHRDPAPRMVLEGPFGDHTGFYSLPDFYPILEVTAITHRRDAIYPTTIVGLPPQEDYYMGKATERVFLPLLRTIVPDIVDYDLPMFGVFHSCAMVKIRKEYPLHARRVMHAIWGAGQMSWTKTVVVVDDDVDVHDAAAVLRALGERCEPARDSELVRGPLDILDHATPDLGAGEKIGLDATRKVWEAEARRPHETDSASASAGRHPPAIAAVIGEAATRTEAGVRAIEGVLDARIPAELGGWWLLVRAARARAGDGARIIRAIDALSGQMPLPRWTIVVGPEADAGSFDDAMFHWVANISPGRDRYLLAGGHRVAFDATPKTAGDERNGLPVRAWPPLIRMSEHVRERVSRRWGELGL